MIIIRCTTGEPVNGVYTFLDHHFETKEAAQIFKEMAVEDGTYWGTVQNLEEPSVPIKNQQET